MRRASEIKQFSETTSGQVSVRITRLVVAERLPDVSGANTSRELSWKER